MIELKVIVELVLKVTCPEIVELVLKVNCQEIVELVLKVTCPEIVKLVLMPGDDLRLLADPENACINIKQTVV